MLKKLKRKKIIYLNKTIKILIQIKQQMKIKLRNSNLMVRKLKKKNVKVVVVHHQMNLMKKIKKIKFKMFIKKI